jgi:hypothetical protein
MTASSPAKAPPLHTTCQIAEEQFEDSIMVNDSKDFNKGKHIVMYLYTCITILIPPSIWTIALHFKSMQNNEDAALVLLLASILIFLLALYMTLRCAKKERQIRYIKSTPFLIAGILTSIFGSFAFNASGFVTETYLYEINKILFFIGLLALFSGHAVFTYGCSILAMNKGRHAQLGWLGGIAGLLGLLILWLIPKKHHQSPTATFLPENQKKSSC